MHVSPSKCSHTSFKIVGNANNFIEGDIHVLYGIVSVHVNNCNCYHVILSNTVMCKTFLLHYFTAAAFKAGKIQNNPFGAGGPGAPGPGGAMIPPPASLSGAGGKAPASSKLLVNLVKVW